MVFIIHPRSCRGEQALSNDKQKKTNSEEVMEETNYWQKLTLNFKQPDAALKL